MRAEQKREVGRAVVNGKTGDYTLIVFETTWDEWGDPEGRIDERFEVYDNEREVPTTEQFNAGSFGFFATYGGMGGCVHDGGGRRRRDEAEQAARRDEAKQARTKREKKVTKATPRVELVKCSECDHVGDPQEFDEPLYECSRCGGRMRPEGERARCSDCHIFMGKVADLSCPACEEECELSAVQGVIVDGEFIEESELPEASRL